MDAAAFNTMINAKASDCPVFIYGSAKFLKELQAIGLDPILVMAETDAESLRSLDARQDNG
jgi:hypothetical protein